MTYSSPLHADSENIRTLSFGFPMYIIDRYHGPGNLDTTLDENILQILIQAAADQGFKWVGGEFQFLDAVPNEFDERVIIQMKLKGNGQFDPDLVVEALEEEGYLTGLTIRSEGGEILYGHENSADIVFRRTRYEKKRRKRK